MNEWIPAKVNDNSSTKIVSKLLRFIVGGSDEWKYFGKGSKVSRIKWLCYGNLFYKTLFLSTLASDCSFLHQSVFVCPPQFQLLSSLSIRQVDKYILINILQLICQLLPLTLTPMSDQERISLYNINTKSTS